MEVCTGGDDEGSRHHRRPAFSVSGGQSRFQAAGKGAGITPASFSGERVVEVGMLWVIGVQEESDMRLQTNDSFACAHRPGPWRWERLRSIPG